jgi:hypothetical protein
LSLNGFNITFASRGDADVWWRYLETTKKGLKVERITPQHYKYTGSYDSIPKFQDAFFKDKDSGNCEILDNVSFTLKPADRLFVIPDAKIRDHVNKET